ncbi:MAG: pyridoxal-phosphate dependent enzyme [bacterium]
MTVTVAFQRGLAGLSACGIDGYQAASGLPQAEDDGPIDREIKQEIPYPESMTPELMDQWGDGIPAYAEADPHAPEWKATPVIPLDLTADGYGEVYIKNEADRLSNPTGTIKDRAAWELATLCRDYARALYLKRRAGILTRHDLERMPIPRLSLITEGNEGAAVAVRFAMYNLPPPKILVGRAINPGILDALLRLRADVYVTNLSRKLTPKLIKKICNNENGIDLTSTRTIEPQAVFYDWHVHEVLNEAPDEVYVPFGSGRLMENYLYWIERTLRNESEHRRDPRLTASVTSVISTHVFGAEPESYPSCAVKLAARCKPFRIFTDEDIDSFVKLAFVGNETGKYRVSDPLIEAAYALLTSHGIDAEKSAAAGLALYMQRFDAKRKQGLDPRRNKAMIVDTGMGLVEPS